MLTRKSRFLEALEASGIDIKRIALAAGKDNSTLHRWKNGGPADESSLQACEDALREQITASGIAHEKALEILQTPLTGE